MSLACTCTGILDLILCPVTSASTCSKICMSVICHFLQTRDSSVCRRFSLTVQFALHFLDRRHLKDLKSLLFAWQAHVDGSVKPAGPQQGIVQALLLIRCPNDEDLHQCYVISKRTRYLQLDYGLLAICCTTQNLRPALQFLAQVAIYCSWKIFLVSASFSPQ